MPEFTVTQPAASASPAAPPAEGPSEKPWDRYMNALNSLYEHASTNEEPRTLADTLTWTLARIVMAYGGTLVAGDIVGRLGDHIHYLAERQNAADEAARERDEGRMQH